MMSPPYRRQVVAHRRAASSERSRRQAFFLGSSQPPRGSRRLRVVAESSARPDARANAVRWSLLPRNAKWTYRNSSGNFGVIGEERCGQPTRSRNSLTKGKEASFPRSSVPTKGMTEPSVRRRRPPNLRIDTQRVDVSGGETGKEIATLAGEYITRQRQRRVAKGEVYLKRCLTLFAVAFFGVIHTQQYTHLYYVCWVMTYCSFFLTLPSVLPSDNNKIQYMLVLSLGNIASAAAFTGKKALEKHRNSCDFVWYVSLLEFSSCPFTRWLCWWNMFFWSVHSVGASFMSAIFLHASTRLSPINGLYRFWKACGIYFIFVATVSGIDLAFSYRSGKYDLEAFKWAGRWNVIITVEQAVIGCLCLSHRFKNYMWAYAASVAAIKVREGTENNEHDSPPKSPVVKIPYERRHPRPWYRRVGEAVLATTIFRGDALVSSPNRPNRRCFPPPRRRPQWPP